MIIDLEAFIKTAGLIGLAGIVFAESGLLIGFFLPGDSLLFTAGILSSQGYIDIWLLCLVLFLAAAIGDSVGYSIGKKLGPKIFTKSDSLFFNKDHIHKTQAFYEKHGGKTIIIARFVPVIRTFAPVMAGVGQMSYKHFISYNLIGALLWAVGLTLLGYFLGQTIPNIDKYLLLIIALIVLLSISPGLYHFAKDPSFRKNLINSIVSKIKNPRA